MVSPTAMMARTAYPDLDLIRMAMHAPILWVAVRATVQVMGGVETELLPQIEYGVVHGIPRYLWTATVESASKVAAPTTAPVSMVTVGAAALAGAASHKAKSRTAAATRFSNGFMVACWQKG